MKLPCALTIAGSDSGGGAGIQADLKTFAALGVHGLCVLTAVTAQNTRGVRSVFELPPAFVREQLDAVMEDFDVGWAKTGMLCNSAIIDAVRGGVQRYGLRVIVDPLMRAATGARLLREDAVDSLLELLAHAEVVTPNVPEAEKLSGVRIRSSEEMRKAARRIGKLGPKAVLIKGGHFEGRAVVDLLYASKEFTEFKGPRLPSGPTHGKGCSFSAAITAELAKGKRLREAIGKAREFIARAIEKRLEVGRGIKPVNPMASLLIDAEKGRAFEQVWEAARLLEAEPEFVRVLPEVGTNVVMALPGAKKNSEVIGLSERIFKESGHPRLTGFPTLGGSEHVANLVLTAMRHDPNTRAALNIRFSDAILRACKKLGLSTSWFDRSKEPKDVKTMVWGTERAIKKAGRMPRVIFDRGAPGKEPMIRLLGSSPIEVAELALRIARSLGGAG